MLWKDVNEWMNQWVMYEVDGAKRRGKPKRIWRAGWGL